MEEDSSMFGKLQNISKSFHEQLNGIKGFNVQSDVLSPIIHLQLNESDNDLTRAEEETTLQDYVDKCLDKGLGVTVARYLNKLEMFLPKASIRLSLNVKLTE